MGSLTGVKNCNRRVAQRGCGRCQDGASPASPRTLPAHIIMPLETSTADTNNPLFAHMELFLKTSHSMIRSRYDCNGPVVLDNTVPVRGILYLRGCPETFQPLS